MKKRALSLSALTLAAILAVGGSIPAATAAIGDTGTTYCSGVNPTPRLKVRAIGFFTATPPGRGYSTYYGFGVWADWYGVGTKPGGAWSAWIENGGGYTPSIDTAQTYGYCSPG